MTVTGRVELCAMALLLVHSVSCVGTEPPTDASAALAEYDAKFRTMREAFGAIQVDVTDKQWIGKKLQHMVDMDQYMRSFLYAPRDPKFSQAEEAALSEQFMPRWLELDRQNTADLKVLLTTHSWFTISEFGKQADGNAWLLVQHADHDPEFQQEVLAKLEKLYPLGETQPANYAYLYDRLAASWQIPAKRRRQRYGTQGQCAGPGKWEPLPMEDPENVDQRRADVGLPPLAEYIAGFRDICK